MWLLRHVAVGADIYSNDHRRELTGRSVSHLIGSSHISTSSTSRATTAKMPMQVMDNKLVNLELLPENPGQSKQPGPGDKAGEAAGAAQEKAGEAAATAQNQAKSTADTASQKAQGAQAQASGKAQGLKDQAQAKGAEYQQYAGEKQLQASDTLKGAGDTAQQMGDQYVQSGTDAANSAANSYLPESAKGAAGSAVGYVGDAATGTVGAVGGGLKDVGDTVGNVGKFELTTGVWSSADMQDQVMTLSLAWERQAMVSEAGLAMHWPESLGRKNRVRRRRLGSNPNNVVLAFYQITLPSHTGGERSHVNPRRLDTQQGRLANVLSFSPFAGLHVLASCRFHYNTVTACLTLLLHHTA